MAAPTPKLRTVEWIERLQGEVLSHGLRSLSKDDPLVKQALNDFSPIVKHSVFDAWALRVEVASFCLNEADLLYSGYNLMKVCPGDGARLCFAIALLRNGYTSKVTEVLRGMSYDIPDELNNRLMCLMGTLDKKNLIEFNAALLRAKHLRYAKMAQALVDIITKAESYGVSRDVLLEVQDLAGLVARNHHIVINQAPDYEFDAASETVYVFYRLPVDVKTLYSMENDVFNILYERRHRIPLDHVHLGFSVGKPHELEGV